MKKVLFTTLSLLSLSLLSACGQQPLVSANAARLQSQAARAHQTPTTGDVTVIERTTLSGRVTTSAGKPLDGITIMIRSLNASVPYQAQTQTVAGSFAFNNAPAGVQVEIAAIQNLGNVSAAQSIVEVLKSNPQGDPNTNHVEFSFG